MIIGSYTGNKGYEDVPHVRCQAGSCLTLQFVSHMIGKSDGKSQRWMSQSRRKVAARNRPAVYPQVSVPQVVSSTM